MLQENSIWVGSGEHKAQLLANMGNRHGLIAGATGTGKTITLKVLAEGFSEMGVPVWMADVKGDLSGMVEPGEHSEKLAKRLAACGVSSFQYQAYPTVFWDVYGEQGHPIRTTVSEMGPTLLSRLLGLNDVQTGVMNILFRVADAEGLLLLDIKDLKAMLAYLGEHRSDYTLQYGNISTASVGAIQRAVAVLENQGGDLFFGEPALELEDLFRTDEEGKGFIHILAADKLLLNPVMYSTFMLWLLSTLYEKLPEVGDPEKPKLVFFFDEAHLLFNNCGKSLLEKIEQIIRLIRSKGVGVYFVTQSPADVPGIVLGQLGNRVQHALRAYTPLEQKAVKVAAQTFRQNPDIHTEDAISNLRTGEALVSFLDEQGAPRMVEQATILPPQSKMGSISDETRKETIESSPLKGVYDEPVDRESAYEILNAAMQQETTDTVDYVEPSQVTVSTVQPTRVTAVKRYDPQTGAYIGETQTVPTEVLQEIPVMVFNPVTRRYTQQMVPARLDPTTGQFVPIQPPAPTAEEIRAQRAAEQAEKQRLAALRRQEAEQLKRERARQTAARKPRTPMERFADTAINTASREITRELTRGIMGSLMGKPRTRRR